MSAPDLAHRQSSRYNGGNRVTVCTCGDWEHDPAGEDGPLVQFAAHVATATERAVREQVARDLEAEAETTPHGLHGDYGMPVITCEHAGRIARGGAA